MWSHSVPGSSRGRTLICSAATHLPRWTKSCVEQLRSPTQLVRMPTMRPICMHLPANCSQPGILRQHNNFSPWLLPMLCLYTYQRVSQAHLVSQKARTSRLHGTGNPLLSCCYVLLDGGIVASASWR